MRRKMTPTTLTLDLGSTNFKACLFQGSKECSPVVQVARSRRESEASRWNWNLAPCINP